MLLPPLSALRPIISLSSAMILRFARSRSFCSASRSASRACHDTHQRSNCVTAGSPHTSASRHHNHGIGRRMSLRTRHERKHEQV
eukprot:46425-Eustigmatos_ZCMA.PRE.1